MSLVTPNLFLRKGIRAIIMGPPGSGKGTVSSRITQEYKVMHISSGDLLRKGMDDETSPVGSMAKKYMTRGQLVPDHIMKEMMLSQLQTLPHDSHWLLDGFPRTVEQAMHLDDYHLVDTAIYLDVPFDTIKQRLSGRWTHMPSGRVYNEEFNPPLQLGYDDVTGEPLIQRPDDKLETIHKRLITYEQETKPLLEYYSKRNTLTTFSGTKTDEIWPRTKEFLQGIINY